MVVDPGELRRFGRLALDCVHRPYPTQAAMAMSSDADARPPRVLTPAFFGCFDWHSAVHGHWLLARVARSLPEGDPFGREALAALEVSLTAAHLDAEARYLAERPSFERPYGLAWLLRLAADLSGWPPTHAVAARLGPLAELGWSHLAAWLPRLGRPMRTGTHNQTAFALGLAIDWARATGRADAEQSLTTWTRAFFGDDRGYALHLEPGGEDFLSPSLGAADAMRRVLSPTDFADWLARAFGDAVPSDGAAFLEPVTVTDPTDGRLAHLDGLNLSRAFMLERIGAHLPDADPRRASIEATAASHRARGLSAVGPDHYEGAHWLGTFAVYLITGGGC